MSQRLHPKETVSKRLLHLGHYLHVTIPNHQGLFLPLVLYPCTAVAPKFLNSNIHTYKKIYMCVCMYVSFISSMLFLDSATETLIRIY